MEFLKDLFVLLGRVLISVMFLWGSFEKLRNWGETMAYMKTKHVPQLSLVMPISIALQILGGLSVLLGWHAHIGAFLLLIVTVCSAFWLHPFWNLQGTERVIERTIFMKSLAVMGGLLLILALGAGHWGMGGGG